MMEKLIAGIILVFLVLAGGGGEVKATCGVPGSCCDTIECCYPSAVTGLCDGLSFPGNSCTASCTVPGNPCPAGSEKIGGSCAWEPAVGPTSTPGPTPPGPTSPPSGSCGNCDGCHPSSYTCSGGYPNDGGQSSCAVGEHTCCQPACPGGGGSGSNMTLSVQTPVVCGGSANLTVTNSSGPCDTQTINYADNVFSILAWVGCPSGSYGWANQRPIFDATGANTWQYGYAFKYDVDGSCPGEPFNRCRGGSANTRWTVSPVAPSGSIGLTSPADESFVGGTSASLDWDAVTNFGCGSSATTSYRVFVNSCSPAPAAKTNPTTLRTTVNSPTTVATFAGTAGSTYCWKVRADNSSNTPLYEGSTYMDSQTWRFTFGATPTPVATATPTPAPGCAVTTSPAVANLSTGGTAVVTANVSLFNGATVSETRFGSYNTSVATVSPTIVTTSPYSTTVTALSGGNTAVWSTVFLNGGYWCDTPGSADTDVNVTGPSPTPTPTPTLAPCSYGPYAIPGRIEAENFRCGGEGVGYHDTDVANN
ncbi:MAG: carbohydrate binding family 6, partial [Microgenomates group bacterium Gr01-1014_16]